MTQRAKEGVTIAKPLKADLVVILERFGLDNLDLRIE